MGFPGKNGFTIFDFISGFAALLTSQEDVGTRKRGRPKKQYICPYCPKQFLGKSASGDYKRHMRIHTGERPYVCEYCNKGFTQKTHMQSHQLTHQSSLI